MPIRREKYAPLVLPLPVQFIEGKLYKSVYYGVKITKVIADGEAVEPYYPYEFGYQSFGAGEIDGTGVFHLYEWYSDVHETVIPKKDNIESGADKMREWYEEQEFFAFLNCRDLSDNGFAIYRIDRLVKTITVEYRPRYVDEKEKGPLLGPLHRIQYSIISE